LGKDGIKKFLEENYTNLAISMYVI